MPAALARRRRHCFHRHGSCATRPGTPRPRRPRGVPLLHRARCGSPPPPGSNAPSSGALIVPSTFSGTERCAASLAGVEAQCPRQAGQTAELFEDGGLAVRAGAGGPATRLGARRSMRCRSPGLRRLVVLFQPHSRGRGWLPAATVRLPALRPPLIAALQQFHLLRAGDAARSSPASAGPCCRHATGRPPWRPGRWPGCPAP